MKILEKIYDRNYNSKNNLLLITVAILFMIAIVFYFIFLFSVKFTEIYKNNGTLIPSKTQTISLSQDGIIKKNYIEIGKIYNEGDVQLEIETPTLDATQKDKATLITIKSPYKSILISSDYKDIVNGYITKGATLCKIISSDSPLIKTSIINEWIGRVKIGQKCIIKNKNVEISGLVKDIKIESIGDKYVQFALIEPSESFSENIGMEFNIRIIAEYTTIKDFILKSFSI